MKFMCSSCRLRMKALHFHCEEGRSQPTLASICDICRQAGLSARDFENDPVQLFAQTLNMRYAGKLIEQNNEQETYHAASVVQESEFQRQLENLIVNYDTNELVQRQVARNTLNEVLWSILTGKIKPTLTGDYKVDFAAVGLRIEYDLNDLDFIAREIIRRQYNHRCQYCGRRGNSVDHKNPVSLSDDNSLENLTLACQECNGIKGNMPYDFFVHLNNQIQGVNRQLVDYENLINSLEQSFRARHNQLIARTHLKNVIDDPELRHLRKQNKELQAAIDSVNSDYLELRNSRRKYFSSQWKMHRMVEQDTII